MDESEFDWDALSMVEENPLYVKYLKDKDDFIKKQKKIIDSEKFLLYASSDNPDAASIDKFIFLCYVTRRYFRDNFIFSVIKIIFGIFAIVFAAIIEGMSGATLLKGIIMIGFFAYGVIMIPLGLLYSVTTYVCYCRYLNYVTTSTSALSRKIIHFYDVDTDKFQAVNWKSIFQRDSSYYHEKKRKRGW